MSRDEGSRIWKALGRQCNFMQHWLHQANCPVAQPASQDARSALAASRGKGCRTGGPTPNPLLQEHEVRGVLVGSHQAHCKVCVDGLKQAALVQGVVHLLELRDGGLVYTLRSTSARTQIR